jgi:hypothetical protein
MNTEALFFFPQSRLHQTPHTRQNLPKNDTEILKKTAKALTTKRRWTLKSADPEEVSSTRPFVLTLLLNLKDRESNYVPDTGRVC